MVDSCIGPFGEIINKEDLLKDAPDASNEELLEILISFDEGGGIIAFDGIGFSEECSLLIKEAAEQILKERGVLPSISRTNQVIFGLALIGIFAGVVIFARR